MRRIFSEAGLMRERVRVECAWFLALAAGPAAHALAKLPLGARELLMALADDPQPTDVAAIKQIEARTNHDVKAVEYWLRAELQARGATPPMLEWMHFACTSEDINNLAYALMLKNARAALLLPMLQSLGDKLDSLAHRYATVAMLARTHGQTATPTTVGKELANVAARLELQRNGIERVAILGKMNGAVGNFNAHAAALPQVDWPAFSARIRRIAGSSGEPPYDSNRAARLDRRVLPRPDAREHGVVGFFARHVELHLDRLFQATADRRGSRLIDHAPQGQPHRFRKRRRAISVWPMHCWVTSPTSFPYRVCSATSATRPCCAISASRSVMRCLVSNRWRRDCEKLELDEARVADELDRAWEVLGEAVQTVMRAHGIPDAYDRLKTFTRGRPMDEHAMREFIASLALPPEEKARLMALTPATYVGLAPSLALRKIPT